MKRTVLVFGLLAGLFLAGTMVFLTLPRLDDPSHFDSGLLLGYTIMVLAFLLVFFGIRSYRENVGGGAISFGRACAVGALITLVASACYVATWQVIYYGGYAGDFMAHYSEWSLEQARAEGATDAELAEKRAEMEEFAAMYRNPVINAGVTLLEPLPVGLIMTLVSAAILRRRRREAPVPAAP